MTLAGAPDWQQQNAPTFTLLGTIAFNGGAQQTVDVTAALLPHHTGVWLYWVQGAGTLDPFINVAVGVAAGDTTLVDFTTLFSGQEVQAPLPGSFPVDTGQSVIVSAKPRDTAGTPVKGTVFVFGVTQLPVANYQARFHDIGVMDGTGAVTVNAGATTTVLPAATTGTYNRVKMLGYNHVAAGAAVARMTWINGNSGLAFAQAIDPAVANTDRQWSVDFAVRGAIALTNGLSVAVLAEIAYEVWSI